MMEKDIERFMKYVDSKWHWLGGKSGYKPKYGAFYYHGKLRGAHRVSYELFNGSIPKGLLVLHSCDDSLCVNPNHLHLGTQLENIREAQERGRSVPPPHNFGEQSAVSKLTVDQIIQIREMAQKGISQSKIAEQFGVIQAHISRIVRRVVWRHVPMDWQRGKP